MVLRHAARNERQAPDIDAKTGKSCRTHSRLHGEQQGTEEADGHLLSRPQRARLQDGGRRAGDVCLVGQPRARRRAGGVHQLHEVGARQEGVAFGQQHARHHVVLFRRSSVCKSSSTATSVLQCMQWPAYLVIP